jgi:coenzyme A diphosphatase NUDT7
MDGCVATSRRVGAATMPTRRADALRGLFDDGDGDADAAAHARMRGSDRAAVLVPLAARGDDGWDVTLTTRATSMRSHAGEIALPGGKRDARDACDAGTAAREAREEIGMRTPRDVEVVGRLPVVMSRHRVSVRPVVGVVREGFRVREEEISREEVAEVFTAPLEMFLSADRHRYDDWARPNGARPAVRVHYFEYEGRTIWGLTAMILIEVARRVYGREPEFAVAADDGVAVWDARCRDGEAAVIKSAL